MCVLPVLLSDLSGLSRGQLLPNEWGAKHVSLSSSEAEQDSPEDGSQGQTRVQSIKERHGDEGGLREHELTSLD